MEAYLIVETVRTLGSLPSVVSASIAAFKFLKDDEAISPDQQKAIRSAFDRPMTPAKTDLVVASVAQIPDRYLQPIRERLQRLEKDYLIILSDPGSTVLTIKQAESITASEVCNFLRLVIKHGNGGLPKDDPFLLELWRVFACEERPSIIN